MFCFAVYMTNFCMEVFNCEISVIVSLFLISLLRPTTVVHFPRPCLCTLSCKLQPVYILLSFHSFFGLNCNSLHAGRRFACRVRCLNVTVHGWCLCKHATKVLLYCCCAISSLSYTTVARHLECRAGRESPARVQWRQVVVGKQVQVLGLHL